MRHLPLRVGRETDDAPGQHVQALDGPELLALVEEQLHAEADAEEGAAGSDRPAHGLEEPECAEIRHAGAERPDARQDDARRGGDPLGIAGHLRGLPDALERLLHGPQVPHPVVDDRERLHGGG